MPLDSSEAMDTEINIFQENSAFELLINEKGSHRHLLVELTPED